MCAYGQKQNESTRYVPSVDSILLCYQAYLRQVLGRPVQWIETLPEAHAKAFIEAFQNKFDPSREKAVAREDISPLYATIEDPEARSLWITASLLLAATVRTNFYQKSSMALAIKIRHDPVIEGVPATEKMLEIFVYHEEFEATHVRSQPIARGGIRWSSREDFRTEVLQLLHTQIIKNTIVVPSGAKGAFLLKEATHSAEAQRQLALVCYQRFIDALLSVTDNREKERAVFPPDTRCYDEEDSYLVIATDRGTATFPDYANDIAKHRGYWLGDAFASGGSQGYDHKGLGITARGAWISVYHHLQHLNIDLKATPLRVVGVGDMSGDIFGNGLLLEPSVSLIAAFNQDFIFIDPHPNLDISYAERKRLFLLPHSNWGDYDRSLLSKGGAIFSCKEEMLSLTPEIAELLNLPYPASLEPSVLIRQLLSMPADLLWLGGIGTFVKGAEQSDEAVEDLSNDARRITGAQVGARIVAEGANLGFTQQGRVEYALKGGCINIDAVDNSAGVDCSDHEVNLKILLYPLVKQGKLSTEQRNLLLKDLTTEVCELVLQDNLWQNAAISYAMTQRESAWEFLKVLKQRGSISADQWRPAELAQRPLTRPDLCLLLAAAKTLVRQHISEHVDLQDPLWTDALFSYFPNRLRKAFPDMISAHLLKDAIKATVLSNDCVNRLGPFFVTMLSEETQQPLPLVLLHVLVLLQLIPKKEPSLKTSEDLCQQIRTAFKKHGMGCGKASELSKMYSQKM
jgi:glutamate dehydrogenase